MSLSITTFFNNCYRSLRPGDQLAVQGHKEGIVYYHHGIFISHEEGIIEFGGANKDDAIVRKIDLLPFTEYGKRELIRIKYPKDKCLPPTQVVGEAKEMLKNPRKWGCYNLLLNNCEHFATRCKTGIPDCFQILKKIEDLISHPEQLVTYVAAIPKLKKGGL